MTNTRNWPMILILPFIFASSSALAAASARVSSTFSTLTYLRRNHTISEWVDRGQIERRTRAASRVNFEW